MTVLDPKFLKVVALMRSTQHDGERSAARARAEAMARAAGMTLDQAIATAEKAAGAPFVNIMSGFADFMEREEPGWKARDAAESAQKERQRLKRRAAIIARYGSEEAALAPCRREQLLRAAIGDLRRPCQSPYERWTLEVDGWSSHIDRPPAHVLHLIEHAYPMPATFGAAMAEHDYWHARRQEIEDLLGLNNFGDSGLDLIPDLRFELIRDLVEHKLETTTLKDLHARFKFYRDGECHRDEIEDALFRDLETLVLTKHLSNPLTVCEKKPVYSPDLANISRGHPSTRDGQIRAALDAEPSRADRDIARACKCSPTTVGNVRRAMGLHRAARSVHRGGQTYQMRASTAGAST